MKTMNNVYILNIESVDIYGVDFTTTRVFTTLEKAKEIFNNAIADFENVMKNNIDTGIIDRDDLYYCWYEDGNYLVNHYTLKIEKGILE